VATSQKSDHGDVIRMHGRFGMCLGLENSEEILVYENDFASKEPLVVTTVSVSCASSDDFEILVTDLFVVSKEFSWRFLSHNSCIIVVNRKRMRN